MYNGQMVDGVEKEGLKKSAFLNLLKIEGAEKEKARRRIEESGGEVLIIVHPFFSEVGAVKEDKGRNYLDKLDSYLGEKREIGAPMVIFEQGGLEYERSMARVANKVSKNATESIYFVPTYWADSLPDTDYNGTLNDENKRRPVERESKMEKLVATLKQLGVTKIEVGGQYMHLEPSLHGCAGDLAKELSSFFEVKISSMAYPDNCESL